jgi:membrane associated rhomboid family serine protease
MREVPLRRAAAVAVFFAALLWTIHISAAALGFPVDGFGIRPGELIALHGVLTAPLAHASFEHLISNTLPVLVLGTAMLYGFPRASKIALPLIWLASGLGVWLFARAGNHLGASGLTHGMMFFVFVMGVLRRDRPSMALAMIVFFLYGGMVWGILPREPGVSFESHFFGAVAGVVAALVLRRRDPLPPRRKYEWEEETALEEEEEDPVIGDLWRDAEAPEVPARRPDEDR